MFKIKHQRTADCVVAGYRVHKSGGDAIGSLSASNGDHAPQTTRSQRHVRLRTEVRDALPPLHDVASDGRAAKPGQHVLGLSG
jgi:hypothetical protein